MGRSHFSISSFAFPFIPSSSLSPFPSSPSSSFLLPPLCFFLITRINLERFKNYSSFILSPLFFPWSASLPLSLPLCFLILAYFLSKRLFPSSSRFLLHFLVFISTSLYLHSCFQSNNFFFQIFLLLSFPSSLLPPPFPPLFLLLYNHVQESNMRI